MKPLVMVAIALFGFTSMALAQNVNGDDPLTPNNRQAPITEPATPMDSPCGAGPTTASLIVRDGATADARAVRDDTAVADMQCASGTPIRTDAPPPTMATISGDGK